MTFSPGFLHFVAKHKRDFVHEEKLFAVPFWNAAHKVLIFVIFCWGLIFKTRRKKNILVYAKKCTYFPSDRVDKTRRVS